MLEELAKNRAEFHKEPWKDFIIPPYFLKLKFLNPVRPRVISGGRGYGKTMLLQYLSHKGQFSKDQTAIPAQAIQHIGLYWRADINFCKQMTRRGLDDAQWHSAFNHMLSLILGKELLASLKSIAESSCPVFGITELNNIDFSDLSIYLGPECKTFIDTEKWFKKRLAEFDAWAPNINKHSEPSFLSGFSFLQNLIKHLKDSLHIENACFNAYIDEYESLPDYQQRIINGCVKFSDTSLLFHIAMRPEGMRTHNVTETEVISNKHDYELIKLEDHINEDQFKLFCSELLIKAYHEDRNAQDDLPLPGFDVSSLHTPEKLPNRINEEYAALIISTAKKIFPSVEKKQIATDLLSKQGQKKKLIKEILETAHLQSPADELFRQELESSPAETLIIIPSLLQRDRIQVQQLRDELKAYNEQKKSSKFHHWIHAILTACLIEMYRNNDEPPLIYAGLDILCMMAAKNVRHFMVLAAEAIRLQQDENGQVWPIPPAQQGDAFRLASHTLFTEVRSMSDKGPQLYQFIGRLAQLFSIAHMSLAQSEAEPTHFSEKRSGSGQQASEVESLLHEAKKLSVLLVSRNTKKKDSHDAENDDYILNPTYAPKFGISYRKGRKIEWNTEELHAIMFGSDQEFKRFLTQFEKKYKNPLVRTSSLSLFDEGE